MIALGMLVACGNDDDASEPAGENFTAEANAICIDGGQQLADFDLELGYVTNKREDIERLEAIRSIREQSLSDFEALEPPSEQVEPFEAYLVGRHAAVETVQTLLDVYASGDQEQIDAAGLEYRAATDEAVRLGADIGLDDCSGVLPSDDAEAAADAVRELVKADPATACSADGVVTEVYVEEVFGSAAHCEQEQGRFLETPRRLPEDIEVSETSGIDDVLASVEYELVGGKFDSEEVRAILNYVDGGWKIYSVQFAE